MIEDFFPFDTGLTPVKIGNGTNGTNGALRGLGETDSWKKPEVENLVTLSL